MESWDRTYLGMKQCLSRLYRKETKQKNFDRITLISKSGTNKCIKFTQKFTNNWHREAITAFCNVQYKKFNF